MVIKNGGMILAGMGILFGLMRAWPLPVQSVQPQEMRYLPPATQAPATSPPAAMTGR
ncbi:MAG: hypothetical protein HQL55_15065 [Magnetococcales bacterium]|nr:hypothetical protein [Magnetococcales bacterium]